MVLGHQLGGLAHAGAGRQVDDLTFDQLDDGSLVHGGGPIPAMDEQNLSQFAAPRGVCVRPIVPGSQIGRAQGRLGESGVKHTGKPRLMWRGLPPVFFGLAVWRGVCGQPDRAKSLPPIKPSPTGRAACDAQKACAQCNVGVKPSRRNTKAHDGRGSCGPWHYYRTRAESQRQYLGTNDLKGFNYRARL